MLVVILHPYECVIYDGGGGCRFYSDLILFPFVCSKTCLQQEFSFFIMSYILHLYFCILWTFWEFMAQAVTKMSETISEPFKQTSILDAPSF